VRRTTIAMADPGSVEAVGDGSRSSPWPATAVFDAEGLSVGGVSATSLAERYGTPLLVVDEADLRDRARAAREAFPRVLFAVTAFTAHGAIRTMLDEGLDMLAATGGEVEACLRAGAPASRIALHGNNKSDAELALAVRTGLSLVIVDGREELRRLDAAAREMGRTQAVLLRVVPDIAVLTHARIATGQAGSKFGTPLGDAVDAVRSCAELPGVRFEGLHAHVGSQVGDVTSYLRSVEALVDLASRLRDELGVGVGTLDVGGGFAVSYAGEPGLDPAAAGRAIRARLRERCDDLDLPEPGLVAEPGRSLVANPVLTLYRVGDVKRSGDRTLVAVDGGMSDNLRPMLYDARFTVASAGPPSATAGETATVVGKHCESGDVLADGVELPASIARGDLLAFAATGAYTYSMASAYNRVGRPAVVAVLDGRATMWLRREDAADMDRFETGGHRRPPVELPSPDGVTIRPATAADARSFLDFWTAIVQEGRYVRSERVANPVRVYRRRFRRPWTDREAQILAVDGAGEVVGHLFIQRESHPVSRHVATLGIAVAAEHRGRGVGTALMAEAFRWARGAGVEKVVLSVYPHNTGAIALYRKFGFVDEGRLSRQSKKSYGYEDEVLMGAWIAPDDLSRDA
jgi:diaminopimelate decarboxylase